MKFSPTWQQVAMLAVLIAAIPLTYAFVAPAAGVVTGMCTTILGSLFVDFRKAADAADPKDGDK